MKKVKLPLYLMLFFCLLFPVTQQAVNSTPKTNQKETVHKKQKKKGFKVWVQKRILKRLEKAANKTSLDKQANFSLLFGILGLILFFVILLTFISSAGGSAAILIPAVFAIVGDVLSIGVLRKTRNDKVKFKKERLKAKWGLGLSLAIGGIPLLLLLIFLIGAQL